MEHKTHDHLRQQAVIHDENDLVSMSRDQRLERWIALLERQPSRQLSTIAGTEYRPSAERATMRGPETPISVAYQDPILRAEGLKDDTYGEARRFFEISDRELHHIVCHCHHGATIRAGVAARILRKALKHPSGPGLISRLRAALASSFMPVA